MISTQSSLDIDTQSIYSSYTYDYPMKLQQETLFRYFSDLKYSHSEKNVEVSSLSQRAKKTREKKYYIKYKEQILKKRKAYYEKNKETIKDKKKEYYLKNKNRPYEEKPYIGKLCKCGCGGQLMKKRWHGHKKIPDYIHNHHLKGKESPWTRKRSLENNPMKNPETRKKVSVALKGRTFSEETIKKMSLAKGGINKNSHICLNCGKKIYDYGERKYCSHKCWGNSKEFLEILNNPIRRKKISVRHKGKTFSKETKKKMSLAKSNRYLGKDNPFYGKTHTKKFKRKMSKIQKERIHTEEQKIKRKNTIRRIMEERGYWITEETREKIGKANKGKKHTLETIKKIIKAQNRRPNGLEKKYIELFEKHSLPYQYAGDGSFFIGKKIPDFININGEKVCIEVFQSYYKIKNFGSVNNYINKRSEYFAKYGWKTIFIEDNNDKTEKEILNILR